MNATAERLAEELRKLPPRELREIWQRISFVPTDVASVTTDTPAALEAIHSLYGRFAGGDMLVHLLQDRARDRALEDEQLRRRPCNHG